MTDKKVELRQCVVIGNGRSIRGVDLKSIKCDTIGMCLAFRDWERIDWYPSYYVCVDHVVLKSNIDDIKKLIDGDKCKGYLLSKSVLKYCPELETEQKILYLEDLQEQQNNPFRYLKSWCSGSSAFLLSIILGYNDVHVIGIDNNYVEFIKESKWERDGSLILTETPTDNPNYYFDDYQRKGDRYNKPNCENVHMPSWMDIVFIITGYTRLNNLYMNVFNYNKSTNKSINQFFKSYDIDNFFKILEDKVDPETLEENPNLIYDK
tara:strand:- start:558 stop:1349 length:792 start_codon:yes stop_codon:yes gene_type:complete